MPFEAQWGSRHTKTKPLSRYGDARVLEVVIDHAGETFRVAYDVRWPECAYVVHVFRKKSKSGRRTQQPELDAVDERLRRIRAVCDEAPQREKDKR